MGTKRFDISEAGEVTVVRPLDERILEDWQIQEMGQQLFDLVEEQGVRRLLLNFTGVQFMSSAFLGKIISLGDKLKARGGQFVMCCMRPEVYEVFAVTRMNARYIIEEDQGRALDRFA